MTSGIDESFLGDYSRDDYSRDDYSRDDYSRDESRGDYSGVDESFLDDYTGDDSKDELNDTELGSMNHDYIPDDNIYDHIDHEDESFSERYSCDDENHQYMKPIKTYTKTYTKTTRTIRDSSGNVYTSTTGDVDEFSDDTKLNGVSLSELRGVLSNFILGIVGLATTGNILALIMIVFTALAISMHRKGNTSQAHSMMRVANVLKIWVIFTLIITAVFLFIGILFGS